MEFVTNIIAADEGDFELVGESECPLDEWSGVDAPGLDTPKLAVLHALLTGESLHAALDLYEPVYVAESGTAVLRISDELFERLQALDEDTLDSFSSELAATEEFEDAQWHEEDVLGLLTSMSDLAQLAESQGQVLYVWLLLLER